MSGMMDKLFPVLMLLGLISLLAAISSTFLFYGHHRDRVERERRVPTVLYVLVVIVFGLIAGFFGLFFGIDLACSSPKSSNLCGLWGFFVTGPFSCALVIFLVGLAVSLVRPAPKPPNGYNSN
jgi:hypothetical protein